jgi:hypothetical protein
VTEVKQQSYAQIARAKFAVEGPDSYPYATFTLRLAFGTVKGYEVDGKTYPPFTTIGGAFEHARSHGNRPPYELPESWQEARDAGRLDLAAEQLEIVRAEWTDRFGPDSDRVRRIEELIAGLGKS